MSKLENSVSTSCFRLTAFLFLFIVIVSARNIDSLSIYEDGNDNDLTPDALFLSKSLNNRAERSPINDYGLHYGRYHLPFYKKRTIPIELQKALYAHGIVGRRR
ncbi:unnamed protein product [Adineta ricciae]|uniref:Uncharacterized protein n=1 Tax=Adineta ricciae TaxID=249248 RepID=A0A814CSA5_ADIRI|nr:unnamed protein product [Adineta ricciae]